MKILQFCRNVIMHATFVYWMMGHDSLLSSVTAFQPTTTLVSPGARTKSSISTVGRWNNAVLPIRYSTQVDVSSLTRFITPRRRCGGSSHTALFGFNLPPSGGGGNNDKTSQLGEIASAVLTFAAVAAFFLSPLGAIFFSVVNSLFALAILIPIVGIIGFNVWQYFYTISGVCPNCGSPVRALKDSTPSFCFNCGSIIQAKDGGIYLANPNNSGAMFVEEEEYVVSNENIVSNWFNELGGVRRTPPSDDDVERTKAKTRSMTIIDVDAERDDKK